MTRRIGINEARPLLGDLVNEAQYRGETATITRNGRAVARLVPVRAEQPITFTDPTMVNPMTVLAMVREHLLPKVREDIDRVLASAATRGVAELTAALSAATVRAAECVPFERLGEEIGEDGTGSLPDTLTDEQAAYLRETAARHIDEARYRIQCRELAWPDNTPTRHTVTGGLGGPSGGHWPAALIHHFADQRFVEILTGQE